MAALFWSGACGGSNPPDAEDGNDDSSTEGEDEDTDTQDGGETADSDEGNDDSGTGDGGQDGDESTGGEDNTDDTGADGTDDDTDTDPQPCSTSDECDNGLWCDGTETCEAGLCAAGTAPCNDGIVCNVDQCDEQTQQCSVVADDTLCDNADACDGTETCAPTADGADPTTGCLSGSPPECDDGVACTVDSCDPTVGCVNNPDHDACGCGETCDLEMGCGDHCVPTECGGKSWQCGDCIDNDGDCKIDSIDPDCWGPCDNNEAGFQGDIPGQNNAPCKMDCYFDDNSGSGDDSCYWDHSCDPNSPQGDACPYNPDATISGFDGTCDDAFESQSTVCEETCGPLVPNGCDCFGCCEVFLPSGESETVYLGTTDALGEGSCAAADAGDPTKCAPCLQVEACLNTCERCEVCLGKPEPPDDCDPDETCEDRGLMACDASGACPDGLSCVTGCCVPSPQ